MSEFRQTDNFVDIELDGLNLTLEGIDEGDEPKLTLDFNISDDGDDLNLSLDLDLGDNDLELVKVGENGYEVLKAIEEDNHKYEHVESTKELNLNKRKRAFISKVIDYCKTTESNTKICSNKSSGIAEMIDDFIQQSIVAVTTSRKMNYTLSTLLMTKGIEFNLDLACKQLDEDFREFINHMCILIDEINREEIINSTGNFLKLDLGDLEDYNFGYVNKFKFTAETKEMIVTCPNCGKEIKHNLIESTKTMNDAIKGKVFLKHNPLVCDECKTVSVLSADSILTCKQHIIQAIEDTDASDRYRTIAPVDVSMLSRLDEAEIYYPEEKVSITQEDIQHFVSLQQSKIDLYDKKFYGNLLKKPENKDERVKLYNYNAFYQVGITDSNVMELYLIGAIQRSGYFSILKDLYDEKSKLITRLLDVSKIQNFINIVEGKDESELVDYKRAEMELDFGLDTLLSSLQNLNIHVNGIEEYTVTDIKKVCKLVTPVLVDCKKACLSNLESIESKVDNVVKYLISNRSSLFRFVTLSKGDKSEYYKVFNSIGQGRELLNKVAPVLVRHVWDSRIVEKYLSVFNMKSRLKNTVTANENVVKKSVSKILEPLRNIKVLADYNSFIKGDYITEMPKEYIALASSVNSRDYYKFAYTVLLLRSIEPPTTQLAKEIYSIIADTKIDDEIIEIFNSLGEAPDYDKFKDKVCEYMTKGSGAVAHALFGDKLSLYDNKELVCSLNMCKYIDNFLNSKNLEGISNIFVKACVQYVDKVYNESDNCRLIDYMSYFEEDCDLIVSDDIEQIEIDLYNGQELANKLTKSMNSFSRRLVEATDEDSGVIGLDQYDQLKIMYSELPKDFKYLRDFTLHMLNDFGDVSETFTSILNLVDRKYVDVLTAYLSCLTDVKISSGLLRELHIDKAMFNNYLVDFEKFVDKVKSELTPRAKVEFELLLEKLNL